MFERFTDRARKVLVLAQEEARLLNRGYIGTEHILLGLLHEGQGVAAKALELLGIELEDVRERVEETIGLVGSSSGGSPPFTPRAKKVLDLALREARQLDHNYIATEHLLLGLVREGEGVGAQVLVSLGADLGRIRQTVVELLSGYSGDAVTARVQQRTRSVATLSLQGPTRLVACSFCGRHPPDSGKLVQGRGALICERCVEEWGDRLARGEPSEPGEQPKATLYEVGEDDGEEEPEGPPE